MGITWLEKLRELVTLAQSSVTSLPKDWQQGAFEIVLSFLLNSDDEWRGWSEEGEEPGIEGIAVPTIHARRAESEAE